MPLYMIRRNVPGLTQEDVDAAAFRAIACSFYFTGLRWERSYWDRESEVIHCIYEAKSAEDVLEHARASRIPCDEVREIQAFGPENYIGEDVPQLAQT